MLLRITYSNTKRLLRKTIESFKSYFPGGYQRLPKSAPCNPFSCTHFTNSYSENANHRRPIIEEPNFTINHSEDDSISISRNKQEKKKTKCEEEEEGCLVTRKLKELEMMDGNNVDLVLDIQEVLHYYSRLTCPVYRDIIDKFFVELQYLPMSK